MFGSHSLGGGAPQTERLAGLPVSVIHLRRDGVRISGQEFKAAVPLIGRLRLGPTNRHQSGGGATHMADLLRPGALELGSVCKPLFNPVIELVDERGLVLSGYEISTQGYDTTHVEQVWLVRPLTASDSLNAIPPAINSPIEEIP